MTKAHADATFTIGPLISIQLHHDHHHVHWWCDSLLLWFFVPFFRTLILAVTYAYWAVKKSVYAHINCVCMCAYMYK